MSQESILVTGATGNLGGAVVKKLQQEGFHIYAVARNAAGLEGATVTSVDLMSETAVNEYITNIVSHNVNLKTVVLLVGGFAAGNLQTTDAVALQKMYQLNFATAYFVVRALWPYFEVNGGGHFILIGARSAFNPQEAQDTLAYSLAKSMVVQLSEIINAQGKAQNIRASVIVPGTIDTAQNRQAMPNADFSKWTTAQAIADAIGFLLTDSGQHLRAPVLKMYNES
ncbi:MAG TPA: SDR family NAD(P)-dependent oxidoreductase [Saprospiraceae bacterium]|nr:SDR family NAD(P)-dependent oxidoreductase [Saprospiraceae bacterium]HMP24014.1 SDR family NAD(P)-dependent oxidoreductase [Saprospiraceae bacterium]